MYFLGLASLTHQILLDLPTLLHVVLGICTAVYSILLSTLQCYLSILLLTYTKVVSDFGHYQQCCYKPSRTCLLVNMDTHTPTSSLHTHTSAGYICISMKLLDHSLQTCSTLAGIVKQFSRLVVLPFSFFLSYYYFFKLPTEKPYFSENFPDKSNLKQSFECPKGTTFQLVLFCNADFLNHPFFFNFLLFLYIYVWINSHQFKNVNTMYSKSLLNWPPSDRLFLFPSVELTRTIRLFSNRLTRAFLLQDYQEKIRFFCLANHVCKWCKPMLISVNYYLMNIQADNVLKSCFNETKLMATN